MQPLNKIIKQLAKPQNTTKTKKTKAKPPVRRRRRQRIVQRRRPIQRRQQLMQSIPMAVPTTYRRYFSMKNIGQTAVRIAGCDLIYKIPDNLATLQNTNVMTVIPANPAYWTGTRIAAVAQGYQNYRPVALRIHYCPQCPVTQQGNVIGGTLWDDVPSIDSMQQSLKTSNGGFLTQCYQPITTTIRLKTNLQINLYRMAGELNQQANPFYFIALSIATYNTQQQLINPGIFYVEYTYILKNPIGTSTQYLNTGITTTQDTAQYYANAVAITCANLTINNAQYPPGTRLDIETTDAARFYYNNTLIPTPTIPIWCLMNQPISLSSNNNNSPTYDVYYDTRGETGPGNVTVLQDHACIYYKDPNNPTSYLITYCTGDDNSYALPLTYTTAYWMVEFTENGVGFPMTAVSSNALSVTFETGTINLNFIEHPGRLLKQHNLKLAKPKIIDYGIIGPDEKDPDFDSSKVHSVVPADDTDN